MLARTSLRALRQSASNGGDSLILPFLYCTRTILGPFPSTSRSYRKSGGTPTLEEDLLSDHHLQYIAGRKLVNKSADDRGARRPARTTAIWEPIRKGTQVESDESREPPSRQDAPVRPPKRGNGSSSRESHVPFEGLPLSEDPDSELEGSTITPSERKAFESLLAIRPNDGRGITVSKPAPGREESLEVEGLSEEEEYEKRAKRLDDILDKALAASKQERGPTLPPALQKQIKAAAERARAMTNQNRKRLVSSVEEEQYEGAVEAEVLEVRQQMNSASFDTDVWAIFKEKVIDVLVPMLSSGQEGMISFTKQVPDATDARILATTPAIDEIASMNEGLAAPPVSDPPPPPSKSSGPAGKDPATLARILAQHTLDAQLELSRRFEGSPFALSILPTIRSLGPLASAFVLGQMHYTFQLRETWRRYQDLPAMLEILQTMDNEVFAFNLTTIETVRAALNFAAKAKSGELGDSVQVMWSMPTKTVYVQEMKQWLLKLTKYRQDEELRRIRIEDAIEGGSIDGERIRFETPD